MAWYDDTSKELGGPGTAKPITAPKAPVQQAPAPVPQDIYAAHYKTPEDAPWYEKTSGQLQSNTAQKKFDAGTQDTAASIDKTQNPGFFSGLLDVAKRVPGAAKDIAGAAITHPIKTAQSAVGGLLDVGTRVANTMSNFGTGLLKTVYGDKNVASVYPKGAPNLPYIGATGNEALGNVSDPMKAIYEGSQQYASYELGQAGVGKLGMGTPAVDAAGNSIIKPTLATRVAGNVAGGQAMVDPNTSLKDRGKQALFDAAFGAAETVGSKLITGTKAAKVAEQNFSTIRDKTLNDTILSLQAPHPEVAAAIRKLVDTGSYKNIKDFTSFEGEMMKAVGDNPKAQSEIKASLEASKAQFVQAMRDNKVLPPPPEQTGQPKFSDILDQKNYDKKVENYTPPKEPQTKYIPVDDLGSTPSGDRKLANTHYDHKTGNTIVEYDRSLDTDPKARDVVLAHEEAHIISKRLGNGEDAASGLPNYGGNKKLVDELLGDFPKKINKTSEDVAKMISAEVKKLTKGSEDTFAERFADAVAQVRTNENAAGRVPTLSGLLKHIDEEGKITTRSTTLNNVKEVMPIKGAEVEQSLKKVPEAKVRDDVVSVNGKNFVLKEKSLEKFKDAKAQHDRLIEAMKGSKDERSQARSKGLGMELAALKRELTAEYTPTEYQNLYKRETANYIGKEVKVEVNGKVVDGEIIGKPAFGRTKVAVGDDRSVITVDNDKISDPRSEAEIAKKILARDESKAFEASTKTKTVDKPVETVDKSKKPLVSSTGLDSGKRVKDTPSYKEEKIDASESTKEQLAKIETENKNFEDARMSKSDKDLLEMSQKTNLTDEDIKSLVEAPSGSAVNAETRVALDRAVLTKAKDLANFTKEIDIENAGPQDLQKIKDMTLQLVAMKKASAGFRTEASNVLRSYKLKLAPDENITMSQLLKNLKDFGKGVVSEEDAALFSDKIVKELELTPGQKVGRRALETWYASILSGPKTSVRNILSTGGNIVTDLASKLANPKTIKEVPAAISGILKDIKTGLGQAKQVLKGEKPSETRFGEVVDPDEFIKPEVFTGKYATYGRVVESVGRFLAAQDKVLSTVSKGIEERAMKVYSPEISDEIIHAMSQWKGEFDVYHGQARGKVISSLAKSVEDFTRNVPLAKIIIPFVKTVSNVLDRQLDYLPLSSALRTSDSFLGREAEKIMTKFDLEGADTKALITNRLKAQQYGRQYLGYLFTAGATALALDGRVSGSGPSSYDQKIQLEKEGWRPNSIKIGDTWIPYTYLGPLAGIFSFAGNINDKFEYGNKSGGKDPITLLGNGIIGWTQSQLQQSFLSGASDLMDVLNGNKKDAADYVSSLGLNLLPIPNAITQTKDIAGNIAANVTGDQSYNQQYETSGFVQKLQAKLGITSGLQPKVDQLGAVRTNDMIYGVTPSKETNDPVVKFLNSTQNVISKPSKSELYTKAKVKFSDAEYNTYVSKSGQAIYKRLEKDLPHLQKLNPEDQKKQISSIVSDERDKVRKQLLAKKR